MDDKDWGLTAKGFKVSNLCRITECIRIQGTGTVWDKSKPDSSIAAGNFLRIFAWITSLLFQLMEDVYNSRFIDTALGNSLYIWDEQLGLDCYPHKKQLVMCVLQARLVTIYQKVIWFQRYQDFNMQQLPMAE